MKYIEFEIAEKIKEVLLKSEIIETIDLQSETGFLKVKFDNLRKPVSNQEYLNSFMENRELRSENMGTILEMKKCKQPSNLFFGIGQWRDEGSYDFDGVHMILGSDCPMLNPYFCQLDLSDAIEDDEYIYILKNITKNAGLGTCVRLYTGKGPLSNEERKEKLFDILNPESIMIGNDQWFAVSKISKKELDNKEQHNKVLTKFLKNFITYAFAVEEARR